MMSDDLAIVVGSCHAMDTARCNLDIEPITNDGGYRRVLKEIDGLMDSVKNTPQGDRLDVLTTRAVAWEEQHHVVELPDSPLY